MKQQLQLQHRLGSSKRCGRWRRRVVAVVAVAVMENSAGGPAHPRHRGRHQHRQQQPLRPILLLPLLRQVWLAVQCHQTLAVAH
jgi:hypothetical protein